MKKNVIDLFDYLEYAFDKKAAFVIKDAMKEEIYIIIDGAAGPQGKSTLRSLIEKQGYPYVIDDFTYKFENKHSYVKYRGLKNYLLIDFGNENFFDREKYQLKLKDKEKLLKLYPKITRFYYRVEYDVKGKQI